MPRTIHITRRNRKHHSKSSFAKKLSRRSLKTLHARRVSNKQRRKSGSNLRKLSHPYTHSNSQKHTGGLFGLTRSDWLLGKRWKLVPKGATFDPKKITAFGVFKYKHLLKTRHKFFCIVGNNNENQEMYCKSMPWTFLRHIYSAGTFKKYAFGITGVGLVALLIKASELSFYTKTRVAAGAISYSGQFAFAESASASSAIAGATAVGGTAAVWATAPIFMVALSLYITSKVLEAGDAKHAKQFHEIQKKKDKDANVTQFISIIENNNIFNKWYAVANISADETIAMNQDNSISIKIKTTNSLDLQTRSLIDCHHKLVWIKHPTDQPTTEDYKNCESNVATTKTAITNETDETETET